MINLEKISEWIKYQLCFHILRTAIIFYATIITCVVLIACISMPVSNYNDYVENTKSSTYATGTYSDFVNNINRYGVSNLHCGYGNYVIYDNNEKLVYLSEFTIEFRNVNMLLSFKDYKKYIKFYNSLPTTLNEVQVQWN